ncbi:GNAT family N-acetyltransferase [uncultured Tateyamaria sp.]|uniref:GNAT family N-acetyltransferase n=1 Tax=uncultured Tateyamaria sp. TaxID=455651 RepID=UPI002620C5F6|nr:GNAT family N-acetyltransferase [uncultured Tateyamaria sp.]
MVRQYQRWHLRLRPFRPDDFRFLQDYALKEYFWRFLPLERQTSDSVRSFLDRRLEDEWGDGGYHCAVELIDAQRLIGTARISVKDITHCSGDIGYALNENFSGEGYMTEAVQKILQIGFDQLYLERIARRKIAGWTARKESQSVEPDLTPSGDDG